MSAGLVFIQKRKQKRVISRKSLSKHWIDCRRSRNEKQRVVEFQIFNQSNKIMTETKLHFSTLQEVQAYAQQQEKTLLILDEYIVDATSFATHHPGGAALLYNKNVTRIDDQMKFHHPLTMYMATTMAIGSFKTDLARIIDPSQPLLSQIWQLSHEDYLKVVNSPHWLFTPSPPMLSNPFLDKISHTKWYGVLPMPWMLMAYMFYQVPSWDNFNPITAIIASVTGFMFFTLVEYILHRFLFHSESYLPDSRIAHFTHFFLHGIHHMLPNDPDRLVLPPPLALFYITIGYFTVQKVLYIQDDILFAFFWSFLLLGYQTYDVIHYALHHVDTSKSSGGYFHRLQQYHNQHHFGGEDKGFGVSSKLWDIVFRSGFTKKKGE